MEGDHTRRVVVPYMARVTFCSFCPESKRPRAQSLGEKPLPVPPQGAKPRKDGEASSGG